MEETSEEEGRAAMAEGASDLQSICIFWANFGFCKRESGEQETGMGYIVCFERVFFLFCFLFIFLCQRERLKRTNYLQQITIYFYLYLYT